MADAFELSVIMPAFNEAQRIGKTLVETRTVLEQCDLRWEVIVVDDGSHDETRKKALAAAGQSRNVKVLGYSNNMGKGYALKYGSQFARGELVLFLDADSDLPASQIPTLLKYMSNKNDVVVGSKRHPLSQVKLPLSRRFLSRGYYLLTKLLFGLDIHDSQTGIKLFRRGVLERVFPRVLVKKYAFDIEVLAIARRLGYGIIEAPVTLYWQPSCRVGFKAIWRMLVDTLAVFYRMKVLHYYDNEGPGL